MDDTATWAAVARIHDLIHAGYKITPCTRGSLFADHPAHPEFHYAKLMMLDDGMIVGGKWGDKRELRIPAHDDAAFRHFIHTVPRPTFWQTHRNKFFMAVGYAIIYGVGAVASLAIIYGWKFVSSVI